MKYVKFTTVFLVLAAMLLTGCRNRSANSTTSTTNTTAATTVPTVTTQTETVAPDTTPTTTAPNNGANGQNGTDDTPLPQDDTNGIITKKQDKRLQEIRKRC